MNRLLLATLSITIAAALVSAPARAQHEMHDMHAMPGMQHAMPMDRVATYLMSQVSGTGSNPAAAPMAMSMTESHGWMLMVHGAAFASAISQSGRRGSDQLTSTNWLMGMADRKLGPGHLMLRSMLSLEPLFMGQRGYPELFQTGETAHGVALVDRQHPHDFIMELAAEYAIDLGAQRIGYLYAAPVGDPALGPVAYPHRSSALELPQATLAHHLQDSTHIANSVVTVGIRSGAYGLGVSGFHGGEPDENRWDIDGGGIDSWSVRATWDPTPQWTAQLSTGHLVHPEALEEGNVQRTTASVTYATPQPDGEIATSLIFGRNDPSGADTNSVLVETNWRFATVNYLTARAEFVDKDEILEGEVENVKALTIGYTRDVVRTEHFLGGIGGNVTMYGVPSPLQEAYGTRPLGFYAFARVRLQ